MSAITNRFIQRQKAKKEGYIEYEWANPGETVQQPKALYMSYFEPWDWIIASSSYLEEFYSPLATIGYFMALTILIMLILIIPITWVISSRLAKPLQEMINVFESGANADFINRLDDGT